HPALVLPPKPGSTVELGPQSARSRHELSARAGYRRFRSTRILPPCLASPLAPSRSFRASVLWLAAPTTTEVGGVLAAEAPVEVAGALEKPTAEAPARALAPAVATAEAPEAAETALLVAQVAPAALVAPAAPEG